MHPAAEIARHTFFAPVEVFRILRRHRSLLWQHTCRSVAGRYRGSYLGMAWSFLHPLLMLTVYTFVFGVIMRVQWDRAATPSRMEFALTLFAGMVMFNIFAEVVNRAPSLIMGSPNYVKKVVFPLEILPVSLMGEALFHGLVSLIILLSGVAIWHHGLPWTVLLLPVVLVPLLLLTLGLGWLFAALGVFIRDIGQGITVVTTILFYLTPIIYPLTAVPEHLRFPLRLNPLAVITEECRQIVLWNAVPSWSWYAYATAISVVVFCLGFGLFQSLKRTFADVV